MGGGVGKGQEKIWGSKKFKNTHEVQKKHTYTEIVKFGLILTHLKLFLEEKGGQ